MITDKEQLPYLLGGLSVIDTVNDCIGQVSGWFLDQENPIVVIRLFEGHTKISLSDAVFICPFTGKLYTLALTGDTTNQLSKTYI
jgi:hypothetical protein